MGIFTNLGVIIVALGICLFSNARTVSEDTLVMMDSVMVSSFNQQFLPYCGRNVKGNSAKALFSIVEKSNALYPEYKITLSGIDEEEIDLKATYTIMEFYDIDGKIYELFIMEN